jgi:hypothetical protein
MLARFMRRAGAMLRLPSSVSTLLALGALAAGCHGKSGPDNQRQPGQTSFVSSPPGGGGALRANGAQGATPAADTNGSSNSSGGTPRTVEETDLYRLEGTRLYYLNGYRGLMVFDVSDVDHPRLLGRSPIYGDPVEMIVRNGVATVVVADWFGKLDDGTPFHGSIVRGIDATDPTNIRILGEALLGGWIRDTRVVGDVLYAVSEDYGWVYGWGGPIAVDGVAGAGAARVGSASTITQPQETVIVSSVSFANGQISAVSKLSFPGYSGIFNVTPNSILLAHDNTPPTAPGATQPNPSTTELLYLDISDPAGSIQRRGAITVHGTPQGWGPDNGRFNLDFADGRTAHVIGCTGAYWGCGGMGGYTLATADFSNPDAPVLRSELQVDSTGWSIAARFDSNRLYLSPDSWSPMATTTPFLVYDLTDPTQPKKASMLDIPGTVWNILLGPSQRIFALGSQDQGSSTGNAISLDYVDVTSADMPALIGNASFGQGWAWTPAAGTFKAFTIDAQQGLVIVPFSGWDPASSAYNNGLQLVQFSPNSIRAAGAAHTKGWVERGIFANGRLVSLSDTALSVVDYANIDAPRVSAELVLARNVVSVSPNAGNVAEVSSDWWGNDVTTSEVRVVPIANAEEIQDASGAPSVSVDGVNARTFQNGDLSYVVTIVRVPIACPPQTTGVGGQRPQCFDWVNQVQVVDLSNGQAALRGKVQLPLGASYWWGYGGFYWYDWYDGADVVQIAGDALAFRRWQPNVDPNGMQTSWSTALFIVDLRDADQPSVASTTIIDDPTAWWGDMRVVGSTLYTTHYEWFERPMNGAWTVRYFVDQIDVSDRAHPRIGASFNVPGILVGGSAQDPSILYTIDYRWDPTNNTSWNELDVVQLHDGVAELRSSTRIDGWVGETFVRGTVAYLTAQRYDNSSQNGGPLLNLHEIDLTNPNAPVDRVASDQQGWGWLIGVEGDRAIVGSGWGDQGVDIYTLALGQAPVFTQFVRTQGWTSDLSRQGNTLFIASGPWGVQKIDLQ